MRFPQFQQNASVVVTLAPQKTQFRASVRFGGWGYVRTGGGGGRTSVGGGGGG